MALDSLQRLIHPASHSAVHGAVKRLTAVATVHDVYELDQTLSTKRSRIPLEQIWIGSRRSSPMTAEQPDEVRQKRQLILAERRKQNRMSKQKLDVRLLAEALCSFGTTATIAAETSSRQTLDGCTVPVTVCQPVALWDRMAQVYQTVMLAIARSGVTVNNLQIYSGI